MDNDTSKSRTRSDNGRAQKTGGGLLGALDLSAPLLEAYLFLLRSGEQTLSELQAVPRAPAPDELPIYLRILVQQGYAQRFQEGALVKYRAVVDRGSKKRMSSNVWDLLED